jgi:hypothetical protein
MKQIFDYGKGTTVHILVVLLVHIHVNILVNVLILKYILILVKCVLVIEHREYKNTIKIIKTV